MPYPKPQPVLKIFCPSNGWRERVIKLCKFPGVKFTTLMSPREFNSFISEFSFLEKPSPFQSELTQLVIVKEANKPEQIMPSFDHIAYGYLVDFRLVRIDDLTPEELRDFVNVRHKQGLLEWLNGEFQRLTYYKREFSLRDGIFLLTVKVISPA